MQIYIYLKKSNIVFVNKTQTIFETLQVLHTNISHIFLSLKVNLDVTDQHLIHAVCSTLYNYEGIDGSYRC